VPVVHTEALAGCGELVSCSRGFSGDRVLASRLESYAGSRIPTGQRERCSATSIC